MCSAEFGVWFSNSVFNLASSDPLNYRCWNSRYSKLDQVVMHTMYRSAPKACSNQMEMQMQMQVQSHLHWGCKWCNQNVWLFNCLWLILYIYICTGFSSIHPCYKILETMSNGRHCKACTRKKNILCLLFPASLPFMLVFLNSCVCICISSRHAARIFHGGEGGPSN